MVKHSRQKKVTGVAVWQETLDLLHQIKARTGQNLNFIVHRLAVAEHQNLQLNYKPDGRECQTESPEGEPRDDAGRDI